MSLINIVFFTDFIAASNSIKRSKIILSLNSIVQPACRSMNVRRFAFGLALCLKAHRVLAAAKSLLWHRRGSNVRLDPAIMQILRIADGSLPAWTWVNYNLLIYRPNKYDLPNFSTGINQSYKMLRT